MPKISDLINQKDKKKKFTRKEYRPWNLSETLSKETTNQQIEPENDVVEEVVEKVLTKVESVIPSKVVGNSIPPSLVKFEKQTDHKEPIANFVKPESIDLTVEDHLIQLSGRQKELLILIIRNLIDNHSLITSPMYAQSLVEKINTSLGTIKNAVRRLEAKGLIKSISKRARGGYYRFEVREEVIQAGQRLFFRP
ncbi:MAG: hypothetical protein AB7R69_05310 [Candidatus Babeliales bacterium]|uniref:Uncharacterized protein n=1 Tax=Candidatus Berkiella aquae TaxID=295108 RepID=A0A0Q9YLK1_9GAMM|nr:hypothetical protein [Candidatus Berkiella aquae]MCS5712852.1 hypothetical protein [Candidatus Berkiella aquae]